SPSPNCAQSLKTRWAHYEKDTKLFETEMLEGPNWLGYLDVESGHTYRIEMDILSDSSCLDVYHPRLLVDSWRRGYDDGANYLDWVSFLFMLSSTGLLLLSVTSVVSERLGRAEALSVYENIHRDYLPPRRGPLPRITLHPSSFGFIAAII